MGCDIHIAFEVRKNGKWERVGPTQEEIHELHGPEYFSHPLVVNRNYTLFSILAGVRGDGCRICKPKGFPEDASEEISYANQSYGSDGHSHSWLTLRELEEYKWDCSDEYEGKFHAKTIPELRKFGAPDDVRIVFFFDN